MEMVRTFEKAGISVEPVQLERIYGITAFRQAVRVLRLIKDLQIDIVQTFNLDSDIYGTLVAKLAGSPLIISNRRDLGVYRKKRHLLVTRRIFKYVDYFLAVCNAAANELAEKERVPPDKITTIHNGFDVNDLSRVNQKNVARIGLLKTRDDAQQCGLSRATGSENRNIRVGVQCNGKRIKRNTAVIGFGHALYIENGGHVAGKALKTMRNMDCANRRPDSHERHPCHLPPAIS
jgi:glycosyltransferase involved in cell wall biosynthesis